MPRFFFNTFDRGEMQHDDVGFEYPDFYTVRKQTMIFMLEVALDKAVRGLEQRSLAVMVFDDDNRPVHTASMTYSG